MQKLDIQELKYLQLHLAFEHALDREKQTILEIKYMHVKELNNDYIYTLIGMKYSKFYRK
ncbi:hypothetical protein [Bacillus cereus]|uniref:hypothetical protein n=1 Tax=Bacillus cereus TaxID=1396 RepID=UPI00398104B3